MKRIRWEEDFGEYTDEHVWLGYLGKIVVCQINCDYDLDFHPTRDGEIYSKLSSAKRGAERMLDTFLRDAGLEVKPDKDRLLNLLSEYGVAEHYLSDLYDEIEEFFVYEFEKGTKL